MFFIERVWVSGFVYLELVSKCDRMSQVYLQEIVCKDVPWIGTEVQAEGKKGWI